MRCDDNCDYWYAETDEYGYTVGFPFCHFIGPDDYAPCVNTPIFDDFVLPDELIEDEERWIAEFGQPYDHEEDYWF